MRTLTLIIILSATLCVRAEDVVPSVTIGGKEYHNVRVQTVRPADLILRHELGIIKVKLEDLPEPFRSQYCTADRLAAAQKHEAGKAAAQSKQEQTAKSAPEELRKEREFRLLDGQMVPAASLSAIIGTVREVRADGVIVHLDANQSRFVAEDEQQRGGAVSRILHRLEQERGEYVYVRCGAALAGAAKNGQSVAFEGRRNGWFENPDGAKEIRRLYRYDAAAPYRSPLLEELRAKQSH